MVKFTALVEKFNQQGEKTGWSYILVPADIAEQLMPGQKKSFRVKGKLDSFSIKGVALIPMGGGDFILPFNAELRKGTGKKKGDRVQLQLQADREEPAYFGPFLDCLADDPDAQKFFGSLTRGEQRYFSRWIESAKTDPTRTRRIAQAVTALARQMHFPEMVRAIKKEKDQLGR